VLLILISLKKQMDKSNSTESFFKLWKMHQNSWWKIFILALQHSLKGTIQTRLLFPE